MTGNRVKFGLTLPNRGVVIGATTVAEMLQLATDAEFLAPASPPRPRPVTRERCVKR